MIVIDKKCKELTEALIELLKEEFIEPMKHHLNCCSEYGSRSFYGLC